MKRAADGLPGGGALSEMTVHELRDQLETLIGQALGVADSTPDVRAVEPLLVEIVDLLQAAPEHEEDAAQVLLSLLEPIGSQLPLGEMGVVEVLEFSMHRLRWGSVRAGVANLAASNSDPRVQRAAARILEAFEDDWAAGEVYDTIENQRNGKMPPS